MNRWRRFHDRRAAKSRQALTKGEAEKARKKRKFLKSPLTAWKKATAESNLLKQLQSLATSGSLGSVLSAAKAVTPALFAAGTIAAVGTVAAAVGFDIGPLAQDETVAVEAERALAETEVQAAAIATVEARLDDVPTMGEFDALRDTFETELAEVAVDVAEIRATAADLDERVELAEVGLVETRSEVAAIDVEQIADNAAAVEVVEAAIVATDERQTELASVLDTVTATATEALGVAVQARDQVAITDAQLTEATQAAALAQQQLRQSSTEVLDAQQRLTHLQADQSASAEQIALAQSEVAQAQADATAAQQAAADADERAAMAQAAQAVAQAQLNDTVTVLTDLGQTVAGVDAVLATTTQTAQNAAGVAAILEAEAVTAEAERVANAAAATQAQAQAVQATTDAAVAQATGTAAQTTADGVADSVQGPIQVTLASGTPSGFVPLNNGLTWPEVIATYDTVTVTIIGSNGVVGQQFPVSAFAAEVPIFFGANDSRRGEITPAFPNLVATGATGLTNQQYTITASGLQPAVAVDPFPLTAGPSEGQDIPAHGWHRGNTPVTIPEDGRYRIDIIAQYASGSGTSLFQGILIDNQTSPTYLEQHNDYTLFVSLTFSASFVVDLSAGQTVDQALSHNSNGTTGWTSVQVLAERIG